MNEAAAVTAPVIARRPTVHMVWTRSIDGQQLAGRIIVARAVRDVARESADVSETVLRSAIEVGWRGRMGAMGAWLGSLVRWPVLPVQCALYAAPAEVRRVLDSVAPNTDIVYLDGVRCYAVLRLLRARYPSMRIVVDLDDLMSRRMALLIKAGETLSPGYLSSKLSPLVTWVVRKLGRLLVRYERRTLPGVEAAIARLADSVILLSSADMDLLPAGAGEHHAILPAVPPSREPAPLKPGPVRFVFIGTDVLTQNRMTIDYLLAFWARHQIKAELVFFGKQVRSVMAPPGVRFAGYVDDIADVYDGHSVLLTPTFLRGGIKTKVLEAFAYGAPVIGNAATFEGMPLEAYPLICDTDTALLEIVRDAESLRVRLDDAARIGGGYIRTVHAPDRFARNWRSALGVED